ncbi:TIGR03619 family F420-dependent LLM class oxidoreductase [Actinacidiphila acidipaludis]|uniref:TIGR03619 family F420-dependent LLM class oxidoreductase n=1 Tax=Actinacidiphila acidipaludis TaxID=2873382 RepID=A0ABS7Q3V0_9ACTN|nr:TIGR03619 family F420-dependent LLM class oxidoreductase [Streptomyces acidipaludis]MBY8876722.1 TIGR03619 family F420-dependent LLM class oxidoreductase [Streptomyces acidipaludis]
MRIATTIFLTDETITPVQLAQELEQRGFAGLYLPEHTHIPVSRATPYPAGEPLPPEYGRTLDAFGALSAAAAVTRTLGLGTAITLVAQHDPIVLAKQIATLDHLSGGRFTLGVGFGWNREEAADHGVPWERRRAFVRDRMAVMRALWAPEPSAHSGEFASVQASHAYPKPAAGTVRTLVGGAAAASTFAQVAGYADGWMPIGSRGLDEALPLLRAAWQEAGRGPAEPAVVPTAVQPSAGKLARLRDLGVEEVIVQLPTAGPAEVLRTLDDYAQYL